MPRPFPALPILCLGLSLLVVPSPRAAPPGRGFVANRGQLDGPALHYAAVPGGHVYLLPDAVVVDLRQRAGSGTGPEAVMPAAPGTALPAAAEGAPPPGPRRGCAVWLRFADVDGPPRLEARDPLPGRCHFFRGADPAGWRTDVPVHGEVAYRDVWPGIDLVLRPAPGGLAYEWRAAPGADRSRIRLEYAGAEVLLPAGAGTVVLRTAVGDLVQAPAPGGRDAGLLSVAASGAPADPVVADDPARLLWSTFLAGDSAHPESIEAVVLDDLGRPIFGGYTESPDFPVSAGAYEDSLTGYGAAFVTQLTADGGSLLWSTFLDGGSWDVTSALAIGAGGEVIVAGRTASADFPTTAGAFDDTNDGGGDLFVASLAPDGSALAWSTFLGGSDTDRVAEILLDPEGNVVLAGHTESSDWPTTPGAFDRTMEYGTSGYVAEVAADGSDLVWSTFLGDWHTECKALLMEAGGDLLVGGWTMDPEFPTTPGAHQDTLNSYSDAFVVRLDATASTLLTGTYFGGDMSDGIGDLRLDAAGNLVFIGGTQSTDLPTTPGCYDPDLNSDPMQMSDAFLAKLDPTGSTVLACTYLGGWHSEQGLQLRLDHVGNVTAAGQTQSDDFPVTAGAFDTSYNGNMDAFLVQLDPDFRHLFHGTFLGGAKWEVLHAMAVDGDGDALLAGYTSSADFPTTPGAFDEEFDAGHDYYWDGFASKLATVPISTECLVLPENLEFGPVLVGTSSARAFTITNVGQGPLAGDVALDDPEFSLLAGAGPYVLAGGQTREVVVRFSPTSAGPKACTVGTGAAACSDVACSGEGVQDPDCWLDPVDLHFGVVWVGQFRILDLVITNTGSAALDLHIDLDDPDGSYAILSGGGDVTLGVGEQHLVEIRFGPAAIGLHLATLLLGNPLCGDVACEGVGEDEVLGATALPPDRPGLAAYPNPFNPRTTIVWNLPEAGPVTLAVYDLAGRRRATLREGDLAAGLHRLPWSGRDDSGRALPSGTYLVRLTVAGATLRHKIALLR